MTDSTKPADPTQALPEPSPAAGKDQDIPARPAEIGPAVSAAPPKSEPPETFFWRLAPYLIAVGLVVELLYFGYRGEVQVCVGKTGAHDFALLGQERTDANRWKFPSCEQRLNLGFSHRFKEIVQEASTLACRRATMLHYKAEGRDCLAGRQHWDVQVQTTQVPPWDKRFYRALFGLE